MTFADPASSVGLDYQALQGSLIMFEVLALEPHIPTSFTEPGEKTPAVRVNVTILDGVQAGTVLEDTLVFPKVLIGQLRSRMGQLVLGRLTQGPRIKAGQNPPWKLEPATAADKAMAEEAVAKVAQTSLNLTSSEPPF